MVRTKGGVKTFYVYGMGLLYGDTNGATETYHFDHIGSTVALTSDDGITVTDRMAYSSYGSVTSRSGATDTPFLFNGELGVMTDPNGLCYMRARYYNPRLMRFCNADPIGFEGGKNWYAFAGNDPVCSADPLGLWQLTIGGGEGLGGYIVIGNNGGRGWFNGQWTVGAVFGVGGGLFASLSIRNTAIVPPAQDIGFQARGGLASTGPFAISAAAYVSTNGKPNSSQISANLGKRGKYGVTFAQLRLGVDGVSAIPPGQIGTLGSGAVVGWGVINTYGTIGGETTMVTGNGHHIVTNADGTETVVLDSVKVIANPEAKNK